MRLYEDLVGRLERQIAEGIYAQGERLPSVRQVSRSHGVSMTTAYHAYNLLESRGLIEAKPQSGYFVVRNHHAKGSVAEPKLHDGVSLDLESVALQVLGAGRPKGAPLGSAYPDAQLFPIDRLLGLMRTASRRRERSADSLADSAGALELRREIAKRYSQQGCSVRADEIILTTGCMNAMNLALSTLLRPGDAVAVTSATFFPMSFSLRRFGLRPVPIPSSPDGVNLETLEQTLATGQVKACLLMTTCHNPLGFTLGADERRRLVRALERYQIPLIENDVYAELREDDGTPLTKGFDSSGLVLHCSSFSNSLSPELGVGWITAGRFRERLLSAKFLSNMSSNWIAQQATVQFLKEGNFDRFLRKLRCALGKRVAAGLNELTKHRDLAARYSRPKGGFMVWVKLPSRVDSLHLYSAAAAEGLSFVPGALFSVDHVRSDEIALNFSFPWTAESKAALNRLMMLVAMEARSPQ